MLTLYSMPGSGHSFKVHLTTAMLSIPFKHVAVRYGDSVEEREKFLKKNPIGKVPLLDLGGQRHIAESNAIILYLAEETKLLPRDSYERAKVYEWMFFEQNYHEPSIATRIGIITYSNRAHERTPDRLGLLLKQGHRALAVMEEQLTKTPYLVGNAMNIADICLYAYTHIAETRGGFDLNRFPAICVWLERVRYETGNMSIEWEPEFVSK